MAMLSALPVHPRSWTALLERDDVVLDRGVLRLRHESTTPDEAKVEASLRALMSSTTEMKYRASPPAPRTRETVRFTQITEPSLRM